MDALSSILDVIRMEGIVCSKKVMQGPWVVDIEQVMTAMFWRLEQGACVVTIEGGPSVRMQSGDFVFIPHAARHRLESVGDPSETIMMTGNFKFDEDQQHPFLRDLPPIIYITGFATIYHQFLQHSAQIMYNEVNLDKPGGRFMLKSLAEMLFINLIRAYLEQSGPGEGFLAALSDDRISRALQLMHEDPAQDWTLESLARGVAMSRSMFAGRFKTLVGETPLTYLTNWRINRAKDILLAEDVNISEVADKVGYQSEAAFNRIFKAKTGKTPAMYRRQLLVR